MEQLRLFLIIINMVGVVFVSWFSFVSSSHLSPFIDNSDIVTKLLDGLVFSHLYVSASSLPHFIHHHTFYFSATLLSVVYLFLSYSTVLLLLL